MNAAAETRHNKQRNVKTLQVVLLVDFTPPPAPASDGP